MILHDTDAVSEARERTDPLFYFGQIIHASDQRIRDEVKKKIRTEQALFLSVVPSLMAKYCYCSSQSDSSNQPINQSVRGILLVLGLLS